MLYSLTSIVSAVGDDAVAVFKTAELCDLRDVLENMRYDRAVFLRDLIHASDMLLGDHKNVNGSLRVDILKRKDLFILINLCRGDLTRNYFTKKAINTITSFLIPL